MGFTMSPEFNPGFSTNQSIFREPVRRKLLLLTIIFMLVCAIFLSTGEFLRHKDMKYHAALENENVRHNLGKVIKKELLSVESQIFRLSLTDDYRDLGVCKKRIDAALTGVHSALKVLRDGGTFLDVVPVNFDNINEITETFHFSLHANSGYNLEVIDLTPKILDIEQLAADIHKKVQLKLLKTDPATIELLNGNISVLTKQVSSVLQRSYENVNKIFYDTNNEIQRLEQKWEKETELLLTLRNWGTFLVVLMGLWVFVRTSRQIRQILQQRAGFAKHLEESRQSLETIIENTPVGIAILGIDRKIKMVNQSILHLLDIKDAKELLGQNCFGFLCAQHATGCPLHDNKEGEFDREVLLKTSQGQPVPVIKSAIPIQLAGEPVILEAFMDISERKKTEEALQRATSKVTAMIAGMEEGIAFTDSQNKVVEVNSYLQKLAEPMMGNLVGRGLCSLFPPENHTKLQDALKSFQESHHVHPFVFQLDNFCGIDCIIRLQPIYLNGLYDGLVLNVVDVSELTLARREAEKALRSKASFLAKMSHEIRTPLNGILGMAELLGGTPLAPEQKHFSDTIESSGEALLALLNDILDFSKMEAGKMQLEHTSFNLGRVVEDGVLLLANRAQEKGLELAMQVPMDVNLHVQGDPHRLRQILTNLISNAIKFTDQGEVIIRVACRVIEAQKSLFRFSITDTGIGLEAYQKEHLFEDFSQADGSTTRRFGGTGLGLSISKQLVEMMGGALYLESTPGEGSTFCFEVPLQIDPDMHDTNYIPEDFSGVKALVVEDHKPSRFILQKQLTTLGLDTQAAETTDEGVRILNEAAEIDPLNVAFFDMNLPELRELEAIRAIRSNPKTASIKVIALAPLGSFNNVENTQGSKIDAILPKPVRHEELLDCLKTLFRPPSENREDLETQKHSDLPFAFRVLVAEDNPVNQQVTLGMLNALGCRTDLTANGREAVNSFKNNNYDLVLMDCNMPVMDGYAAAREIRHTEAQAGKTPTPIIALTAETREDSLEKTREAGMTGFLSKPFTKAKIQRELARWMK
jgi:two-component system, sensor histidine kinase and response regulator